MSSRLSRFSSRPVQAWNSSTPRALPSESIGSRWRTWTKRSPGRPPTRWVGESGVISAGILGLERAQLVQQRVVLVVADRRVVVLVVGLVVAGDLGAELGRALCARRGRSPRPRRVDRRRELVEVPAGEPLDALTVGEVEVDRRQRDAAGARRRARSVPVLVLERRLEAVDLVAPAGLAVVVDEPQLVVVEALAEPRRLDALDLAGGAVDVEERARRAAGRRRAGGRSRGRSPPTP